jgi:hypothetical protein
MNRAEMAVAVGRRCGFISGRLGQLDPGWNLQGEANFSSFWNT